MRQVIKKTLKFSRFHSGLDKKMQANRKAVYVQMYRNPHVLSLTDRQEEPPVLCTGA